MKIKFLLLGALLIALQVADGFITEHLVATGKGTELNPLLTTVAGEWWFGFAKLTVTVLALSYVLWRIGGREEKYRMASKGLLALVIFYSLVVAWNVSVLVH